ncbi:MAG: MotA/TolQ/ExbB proton channel family protein [Bacteroidales bacterium]|nr:MotA/TolQ/ExbB proton channel family protein [Bacteroidales bacterium]
MLLQTNLDSLQAAAEAINNAAAAPVQQEMNLSLISMATKGGPLMIVLLILSIVAIFIFGKKWWMIRQANVIDKNFMNDIRDYIHDGKIKSAITLCQRYDSPIARLVEKGLSKMGYTQAEIRASVENTGNIEVARLEKGLSFLATTAGGAPMIGFLGTVIGMIQAFFNMSQAGNNIDITLLSSGIYTAMVTTVGGLIVGILAYFGYNFLSGQISSLVFKMENTTMDLMDLVNEPESTEE